MTKVITTDVRGVRLNLAGYTRALELCARMNRETEVLDFIDSIPRDKMLFDLGACEGRFALYAAVRGVNCYAFEPEQMNYEALRTNIELNPAAESYLTTFNLAVGNVHHQTTIKIGQPWAGGHHKVLSDVSSRVDLDFDFTSEQSVEVVALDEFISEAKLPDPDYLKVDIDGSEVSFLRGASKTLQGPSVQGIIFELHEADASYQEVNDFLSSIGFRAMDRHEVEPGLFNIIFRRGQ